LRGVLLWQHRPVPLRDLPHDRDRSRSSQGQRKQQMGPLSGFTAAPRTHCSQTGMRSFHGFLPIGSCRSGRLPRLSWPVRARATAHEAGRWQCPPEYCFLLLKRESLRGGRGACILKQLSPRCREKTKQHAWARKQVFRLGKVRDANLLAPACLYRGGCVLHV